jgi:4-hydroxybenzoate polyprenyltransferase
MTSQNLPQGRHQSLLLDQLADARTTKGSLEQRGLAVIATAGTLVTITLGFVALATRNSSYTLRPSVVILLLIALAAVVAAAAAGLFVNLPARIPVIDAGDLARIASQPDWDVTDRESSRAEHQTLAHLLAGLRKVNQKRALILFLALLFEVLALLLMGISVAIVLVPMA